MWCKLFTKTLSIDADAQNLYINDRNHRGFFFVVCKLVTKKYKFTTFYLWQINIVLSSCRLKCELIDKYNVNSLFDNDTAFFC